MIGGQRSYTDPEMSLNGQTVKEKGYLTEMMTQRACEFLDKQSAATPFFLTIGYLNPHTPYSGHPQKYYDMYANTSFDTIGWEKTAPNALRETDMLKDPVGNIRKCAASTTALDDQIPVLIRKLQEHKFWDNTLILFTGRQWVPAGASWVVEQSAGIRPAQHVRRGRKGADIGQLARKDSHRRNRAGDDQLL